MTPNARNTDPETSHEASKKVRRQRDKVIALAHFNEILAKRGWVGLTNKEFRAGLVSILGYDYDRAESLRRRLTDLCEDGDLMLTGEKRDGSAEFVPVKAA